MTESQERAELQPVTISFRNVTYTVKDKRTGNNLEILKGLRGKVEANRLLSVMGSSGAGKTTLLDVLACNVYGGGIVGGEVLVNGAPRRPTAFSQISCYVLQRDVLLASSTVREAIMLAALLKLPRTLAYKDKVARVESILAELELEGCANTLIGDEVVGIKGISGGQRRRVSVGIELVKSPRVLFLDEPTSGLDSEMAVSLIDTLVKLARQNRTVCTTIHQPNSFITAKFDDFMLLHAGSCVYFGPWADAVAYFSAAGCPCPNYMNPTDFFMAVLKEKGDELVLAWDKQEGQHAICPADLEAGGGDKEEAGAGADVGGSSPRGMQSEQLQVATAVPWHYQVYYLSQRLLRMWWRNPIMLTAEFSQYAFMAIFVGLMYLQVSNSLATGVSDRAASIWFAMAILSFTPSYTAATIWDKERLLLRRESSQGMYGVTAWFAAKTATTTPVEIVQTALFSVVVYFMVGYAANLGNFLIFLAAFCMFQITSESIGVMAAAATGNSTYAILVLTFVLLFLLSFSGFLVSDVPVYFRWIQKISFLTYAFAAVVGNEFQATTFYDADGAPVSGKLVWDGEVAAASVVQINNGLEVGVNMVILASIMILTRAMAFFLLFTMAKMKRL